MPSAINTQITTQFDLDIPRLRPPPDNSMEGVQVPPLPPPPSAGSFPA